MGAIRDRLEAWAQKRRAGQREEEQCGLEHWQASAVRAVLSRARQRSAAWRNPKDLPPA